MSEQGSIRVQVPTGIAYAGILAEAASKVAWRADYSDDATTEFAALIERVASAVGATEASIVALELDRTERGIDFLIDAIDNGAPLPESAIAEVTRRAEAAGASISIDAAAARIRGHYEAG